MGTLQVAMVAMTATAVFAGQNPSAAVTGTRGGAAPVRAAANPEQSEASHAGAAHRESPGDVQGKTRHDQGRHRHRGAPRVGAVWRRSLLQPGEERVLRRHPVLSRGAGLHGAVRDATAIRAVTVRVAGRRTSRTIRSSRATSAASSPTATRDAPNSRGRLSCSSTSRTTRFSMDRASRRSARSSKAWM